MSFGISKAIGNLFAGTLADRFGRKGVLLIGWLIGLPVPIVTYYRAQLELGHCRQSFVGYQSGFNLEYDCKYDGGFSTYPPTGNSCWNK